MKIRRGTCGLCKPTKRLKRRNRKRELALRRDVASGVPFARIKLREHHR